VVTYVRDSTGRFPQRPFYKAAELDHQCETIITNFLKKLHGKVEFPISTDDLTKLIEQDTSDFDSYADLSAYDGDVEGLTEFFPKRKPAVKIAAWLMEDGRYENRLRTTMTHEYGHVRLHAYLWELDPPGQDLLRTRPQANKQICKRDNILGAKETDWMEWQAGYACGALLIPITAVRKAIQEHAEAHELYGSIAIGSPEASAAVHLIMDRFQVSQDAAKVRLLQLGILTPDSTQSLFK
jgi:hypothetical protein